MGVGDAAATALALIFHELATNSLKYGALSVDTGILDLSGATEGDDLVLAWTERGGPQVEPPAGAEGYGSKLVRRSISGQLGGSIKYDWSEQGVVVELRLNAGRLAL
jgi:two-component sensor histidine kinase